MHFSLSTRQADTEVERISQNKRAFRLIGAEFAAKVTDQFSMYVSVFLQAIGYSAIEIGLLNSINSFIGIFASPTWGIISDMLRSLKKVLLICLICSAALFAFIPLSAELRIAGFALVFLILPLCNFFKQPAQSLMENWVVRESAEHQLNFGLIRSFGSFSYAVMGIILGFVLPYIGGARATFYIYPFTVLPVILICLTIREKKHDGGKKTLKFREMGFGALFKNYYYVTYMLFTVILRFPTSCIYSFIGYLLADINVETTSVGFILGVSAFVEIPALMLFRWVSRRVPLQYLIIFSACCSGAELLLLHFATELWQVVLIMGVLQGIGGGVSLAASPNFIYILAPENLKATAQTLSGATTSIAGIAGATIGGILVDLIGASAFYFYAGLLVGIAVLLYFGMLVFGKRVLHLPSPPTMCD